MPKPTAHPEPVGGENRIVIQERLVRARAAVGPAMRETLSLETYEDRVLGSLVYQLTARVQSQQLAEATVRESTTVCFEHPTSTWQMFKSRHASSWWLGWLVRRRPVWNATETKTVALVATWTGWATFPDSSLAIADDRLGKVVYQLESGHRWEHR